jgi:hypothetical protein
MLVERSKLNRFSIACACFTFGGCNPIPSHTQCNLPYLEKSSEFFVVEEIGTWGFYKNYCPEPINRVFEVRRSFGVIKFEWWGSPHRLYMSVQGDAKDIVQISINASNLTLERVDIDHGWLSQYSHRITFPNNDFVKPVLPDADFELVIKDGDGVVIDRLDMRYTTVVCTCSSIDAI